MKARKLSERKIRRLKRIHELLDGERFEEAQALIDSFSETDKRHPELLPARLQVSFALGAQAEALEIAELWCRLSPGVSHVHCSYMLALVQVGLFALAYQEAQLLKARKTPPAKEVRESIDRIEADYFHERFRMFGDDIRADSLLLMHDLCRKDLLFGNVKRAMSTVEELLEKAPEFLPGRNNYAVALLASNRPKEALQQAEFVLARQPDYSFAIDLMQRAKLALGEKLETANISIEVSSPGLAEQLSVFVREFRFQEIVEALRPFQVEAIISKFDSYTASRILHFWAFAAYSLGDWEQAGVLWRSASNCAHSNSIVRDCLDAYGEEEGCVYAFPISEIVPSEFENLLDEITSGRENEFLEERAALLASLLVLGDSLAVNLAVKALALGDVLVCESELSGFVQGRRGTVNERVAAAHILAQKSGRTRFSIWQGGQIRELEMKEHIPRALNTSPAVMRELKRTVPLFHKGKFGEAEKILRAAIKRFPNEPVLWNNLSAAVSGMGRSKESRQIIEHIVERFPEYPFGRINLAKLNISEGRIEEARALLAPVSARNDLHLDEVKAWQSVLNILNEKSTENLA